jgi:hypothetical protein
LDDSSAGRLSEGSGAVHRASIGDDQFEAADDVLLEDRTNARLDVLFLVTRRNDDRDAWGLGRRRRDAGRRFYRRTVSIERRSEFVSEDRPR